MVKKYVTSIITLLLSSIAFSQISTDGNSKSKDTLVCIPKPIAKEVLRDLYRKDSLQSELNIVNKNYELLESSSILKDSVIANKTSIINIQKKKESDLDSIIAIKDAQIKEYTNLSSKLKSDLSKSKKTIAFHWGATLASFLLAIGAVLF